MQHSIVKPPIEHLPRLGHNVKDLSSLHHFQTVGFPNTFWTAEKSRTSLKRTKSWIYIVANVSFTYIIYLHISNTWNQLGMYTSWVHLFPSLCFCIHEVIPIDFMFHTEGFRGFCLRWVKWLSLIPILIQYQHLAPYTFDAILSLVLEECGHMLTWSNHWCQLNQEQTLGRESVFL